jgi:hypothetical protein
MKIELTVEYTNGTKKDVDAVFADFVAFERTWNRSVTKFEQEMRLTDLAWLAWHSEKRMRKTSEAFEPNWIESVTTISIREEEEEGTDPLVLTQPIG